MPTPNPMTRREHKGSASPATLTASMSAADTAFSISTNTGWPTGGVGPFFVVVDAGTGSEEKILCQTQSTSVVTVAGGGRGADGTIAKAHQIGAIVYPVFAAQEADEANEHAASISDIHGVSGSLPAALAALQPLDADLTAIAALASTGLLARTGGNLWAQRTITSSDSALVVTNGDGVAGNPSLAITEANLSGIPQASVTNLVTDLGSLGTRVSSLETLPLYVAKSALQTVTSSTTLVNDTHLFLDLVAGLVYEVVAHLAVSGNGTNDIKVNWATTGGVTFVGARAGVGMATAATSLANSAVNIPDASSTNDVAYGTDSTGLISLVREEFLVSTPTAGRLTLRWAQNVSNASATNVWNTSWLRAQPVGRL